MDSEFLKLSIILAVLILFAVFILGKNFVIYFNNKDCLHSFSPVIAVLAGWLLFVVSHSKDQLSIYNYEPWAIGFFCFLSILLSFFVIKNSVGYNKNIFFGVLTGLIKIALSPVGLIVILFSKKDFFIKLFGTSQKDSIFSIILIPFHFFNWIGQGLFNGYDIYNKKKWDLPS